MDSIKISDFDLEKTLKCGQLFRYEEINDFYLISHRDKLFKIKQEKDRLLFSGATQDFITDFFRLDDDYSTILEAISQDDFMRAIIDKHYGMRIIRQDPWECLISYLCSARKNIPGIKENLSMICEKFGETVSHDEHKGFSFPAPGEISDHDALRACKVGFRSKYIHGVNRNADERMLIALRNKSYKEAKAELLKIPGVGDKISDCIALFSLDKLDAFPVDTWIRKGMTEEYFGGKKTTDEEIKAFASKHFGKFMGYANQYIFFHWRTMYR